MVKEGSISLELKTSIINIQKTTNKIKFIQLNIIKTGGRILQKHARNFLHVPILI